jgi:hypothetical protein
MRVSKANLSTIGAAAQPRRLRATAKPRQPLQLVDFAVVFQLLNP